MSNIYDFVYKSSIPQIVERISEQEAMLKRLEYVYGRFDAQCPVCENEQELGHAASCELAKLLKGGV